LWAKNASDMKSTTEPTCILVISYYYKCYALSSSSLEENRPIFSKFPEKNRKKFSIRSKGLALSTLPHQDEQEGVEGARGDEGEKTSGCAGLQNIPACGWIILRHAADAAMLYC